MVEEGKIELLLIILILAIIALIIVYITDAYYRNKRKENKKKNIYEKREVEETIIKPVIKEEKIKKYACENCGTLVDENAISCPSCGLYFESEEESTIESSEEENKVEYTCENCGAVVDEDAIICPKCGFFFENEQNNNQQKEVKIDMPKYEIKASKVVRDFLGIRALQYFGVVVGCTIIGNTLKQTLIGFFFVIFGIICLITVIEFAFYFLKSIFIDFSYEQEIKKLEKQYERELSLNFKVDEHLAWLSSNPKKIQMLKNEIVRYYLAKSIDKYSVSEKLKRIEPDA